MDPCWHPVDLVVVYAQEFPMIINGFILAGLDQTCHSGKTFRWDGIHPSSCGIEPFGVNGVDDLIAAVGDQLNGGSGPCGRR